MFIGVEIYLETPDGDVLDELKTGELIWSRIQGCGDRDIWFALSVHRNFDVQYSGFLVDPRFYDDHLCFNETAGSSNCNDLK